jgi:hypothetical protein
VWEYKSCKVPKDDEVVGRAGHSASLLPGRKLLVFGGQNKQGQMQEMMVLDLNKMEWVRVEPFGRMPQVTPITTSAATLICRCGCDEKGDTEPPSNGAQRVALNTGVLRD